MSMVQRLRRFWHNVQIVAKEKLLVPDYRRIQQEVDISKLFLLTSFYRLDSKHASNDDVEKTIETGKKTLVSVQEKQVQTNIHEQVRALSRALDNIFLPWREEKEVLASESSKPSGLAFAVAKTRHDVEVQKLLGPPVTATLSRHDLDEALRNQIGFSLHLRPSDVAGPSAGDGVFLDGVARAGSVVAFYPGVVYSPSKYRYIPGYPKIAEDNPYLVQRYDGIVIDGKSWGRGGQGREWWNGLDEEDEPVLQEESEEEEQETPSYSSSGSGISDSDPSALAASTSGADDLVVKKDEEEEEEEDEEPPVSRLKIELIERRNPLALAHMVNHPPKGRLPNVMVCPYDFPEFEESMRPYIPNLRFDDDSKIMMVRRAGKWVPLVTPITPMDPYQRTPTVLRGLVLVATRYISNEELLLNYRLSHPDSRPSWYHPVDEDEDKRRWVLQ